jgi:carbonic anhydrase
MPHSIDSSLTQLTKGNQRFIKAKPRNAYSNLQKIHDLIRGFVKAGQQPYAAILTCADARIPLELVFDAKPGDLFVVRVAGNIATPEIIASLEFAVAQLAVPVILVLGHTNCGALGLARSGLPITAIEDPACAHQSPHIQQLVNHIQQKIALVPDKQDEGTCLQTLVAQTCEHLAEESCLISSYVEQQRIRIVGGVYATDSGKVNWLSPL